jgi:multidrug efflux pump subunit AcrA (membrane-fusion protein)
LLAREQPWSDAERHIVNELADSFAHAWAGFLGGRRRSLLARLRGGRKYFRLAVAAAVIGGMFLPISLSALAPAEVVPFQPTIVRAPLDGVVDHFAVAPNAPVKEGQTLLELDPRAIQNKLDVAGKALAVAEAEYRQAAQEALFDEKSRAKLTVLKARADQRRTDVSYAQSLLDRIHVTASRDGLALFDDPNDWIGRPVTIGERLLEIADPTRGELEIWLPIADAITLKPGAEVEFFLNIAPGSPLHAMLRQASYEASLSPANLLGYRLKATLDDPSRMPRIGLRGTAKIYGEKVTLFYYLARRPLAAARQFLGL